jgi:para-nitrobenzyl esterase
MRRKGLATGITLCCVIAFFGIGKAETAMPRMKMGPHLPGDLHLGQGQQVRKKCSDPVIITEGGPLKGIISPDINEFLGIPYAASPVGSRRWTPPQPHERWNGVLEATQMGNACPQLDFFGNEFGSEDCLFLNVYTPGLKRDRYKHKHGGLPVMVWIHGGALVSGSGGQVDPAPLVKNGHVIVVTFNYRLGILGFFAHPALDAEGHLNANYGLMDQQFVLQWVQRNIAAFGGDPDRVTIFGESSGGLSVYSQLASPTAAGLFQRAIAQSGAYSSFDNYGQSFFPLLEAEALGAGFAGNIGCDNQTTECLRSISDALLVHAQPGMFYPIIDGDVLKEPPGMALASGRFNQVPVITGTNHDEARFEIALTYDYQGRPLSDADYPAATAEHVGLPVDHPSVQYLVQTMYPLSNYPPPSGVQSAPLALGAWMTDAFQACPGRNAAQLLSQYVPTYMYEFNDENAPLNDGLVPPSFPLGAYHSAEIQYLFNHNGIPASFNTDQQQLSDTMIDYWTQFAKRGNPNSPKTRYWPPYDARTDGVLSFSPPSPSIKNDFDADHKCSSFWNTISKE